MEPYKISKRNRHREWREKERYYKRRLYGERLTLHHNIARSLGGKTSKENLLLIKERKHRAFNDLFGATASIDEAIKILIRLKRAKNF